MFESSFVNKTPTTRIIINTKAIVLDREHLLKYENPKLFSALCKEGCPNYGKKWSCPPHSPTYSKYSLNYSRVLLMLFYCYLDQFCYTKTAYMRVKASNSILKSRMDAFMRSLEKRVGGKMLSNGSCRLCKPCALKNSNSNITRCKKPDQMRFSMESLGLNVGGISSNYLEHDLLWYKDKKAPIYSSVVSALLTNRDAYKITDLLTFPAEFGMP